MSRINGNGLDLPQPNPNLNPLAESTAQTPNEINSSPNSIWPVLARLELSNTAQIAIAMNKSQPKNRLFIQLTQVGLNRALRPTFRLSNLLFPLAVAF